MDALSLHVPVRGTAHTGAFWGKAHLAGQNQPSMAVLHLAHCSPAPAAPLRAGTEPAGDRLQGGSASRRPNHSHTSPGPGSSPAANPSPDRTGPDIQRLQPAAPDFSRTPSPCGPCVPGGRQSLAALAVRRAGTAAPKNHHLSEPECGGRWSCASIRWFRRRC